MCRYYNPIKVNAIGVTQIETVGPSAPFNNKKQICKKKCSKSSRGNVLQALMVKKRFPKIHPPPLWMLGSVDDRQVKT